MTQTTTVNRFDFVEAQFSANLIEEGAFCHFRNADGDLLYLPGAINDDGSVDEAKRVGAYVRSTNSKAYATHLDVVTRRAIGSNRKAKSDAIRDELIFQQLKTDRPETYAVLITKFLNTSAAAPGEWVPTMEEKLALAGNPHNRPNVDQVIEFASDASHYGQEAAPGNAVAA